MLTVSLSYASFYTLPNKRTQISSQHGKVTRVRFIVYFRARWCYLRHTFFLSGQLNWKFVKVGQIDHKSHVVSSLWILTSSREGVLISGHTFIAVRNFNTRNEKFHITDMSRLKIGINIMCNRLKVLNDKINLDWLNLSLTSYKLKMKEIFLSNDWWLWQ